MGTNNRTVSSLRLFDTLDFFESPDIAAFNPAGAFGAYALVSIDGAWQSAEAGADPSGPQFIWGNLDTQGAGGWGFMLTNTGQVPEVSVFLGVDTPANVQIVHPLDGSGPPVQWAGRIMHLGLWYDGINLYFTCNGTILGVLDLAGAVYLPSALPARVGQDPNDAVDAAFFVGRVHSVGYVNNFFPETITPAPTDANVGFLASASWRAVQEDLRGSYILKEAQSDWSHRYNAGSLTTPGITLKTPNGAVVGGGSTPLPQWIDEGNQQWLEPIPNIPPVNLVRSPQAAQMIVDATKNPEFYHGGVFTFVPPPA